MKKIDFLILYEHVAREWNSVILLKNELNNIGLRGVVLPIHYNKYMRVLKYKPKIIIMPYLYNKKTDSHLQFVELYGDISVLNLHSEQIYDETTKQFQKPQDDYAVNAYHISWGEKFAKLLLESKVPREKIFITGSIRNDEIIHLHKNEKNNDVLIPTSFSKTFVSDEYIKNLLDQGTIKSNMYIDKIKFTKKVRDCFFRDVFKLAEINPQRRFIFRPHPYVEVSRYKDVFLKINNIERLPENISISQDGSIHQAISKVGNVICWYTSTLIDAQLLGRNVFLYEPINVPSFMQLHYLDKFRRYECIKELDIDLNNFKNPKTSNVSNDFINETYGPVDGRASKRIACVIEYIIRKEENSQKQKKMQMKVLFKLFCKSLCVDVSRNILKKMNCLDKVKPFYRGILKDDKKCLDLNCKENQEAKYDFQMFVSRVGYIFSDL